MNHPSFLNFWPVMFALREGGSREVDRRASLNGPNQAQGWNNHQTNPGYPAIPPHLFLFHKFWGDLTCFVLMIFGTSWMENPLSLTNSRPEKIHTTCHHINLHLFTGHQDAQQRHHLLTGGMFSIRSWTKREDFELRWLFWQLFWAQVDAARQKTPFRCPDGKNQRQNSKEIPPWKLTWHWKIPKFQ